MEFQDRLYRLRKERGISQEELADVVGVSRQAVQKWEAGSSRPDMDNLVAITRYFDVTLDYLIQGVETPAATEPSQNPLLSWHYEYKSKFMLWGLPLIHINLQQFGARRAKGIIAIGNIATGVLSIGMISAGLLSIGPFALGAVALGGFAIGGLAIGGLAIGLLAVGGAALGIYSMGGGAAALNVAVGGAAAGHIAIGDGVRGAVTFQKDAWTPDTPEAIRAAITQAFPYTPHWLVSLFSDLH